MNCMKWMIGCVKWIFFMVFECFVQNKLPVAVLSETLFKLQISVSVAPFRFKL